MAWGEFPKCLDPHWLVERFTEFHKTLVTVDHRASGDFKQCVNAPLVDKYFRGSDKITLVGGYMRRANLSQDRTYDYRLKGLVRESDLDWGLPTHFNVVSNYKGVAKYSLNPSHLWEKENLSNLYLWFEKRIGSRCRGQPVNWQSAWPETDHSASTGWPVNQKYREKSAWYDASKEAMECKPFMLNPAAKVPIWTNGRSPATEKRWQYVDGKMVRVRNPFNLEEYRDFVAASCKDECVALWNTFLKNEARLLSKLLEDSLRQINGGDVRFIALKCETDKMFNDRFVDSWRDTFSKAGLPIQYGGWDWLYRQHEAKGEWSYIWDIEKQDSTLPRAADDFQLLLRKSALSGALGPRGTHIMHVLHENTVGSYIIMPDGLVVKKQAGNPSGDFDTLVRATLWNMLLTLWCWVTLSGKTPDEYEKEVMQSCMGDDGWTTGSICSPEGPEWWSPQSIVKKCADYGIVVNVKRVKTKDAVFISHSTRYCESTRTYVPYPCNIHKAIVNVLHPPKRHMNNECILLGRVLAQRNRFFADVGDPESYWALFERIAAVYRPLAEKLRYTYPADYQSAKSLDVSPQAVSMLYMLHLEKQKAADPQVLEAALKAFWSDGQDSSTERSEEGTP